MDPDPYCLLSILRTGGVDVAAVLYFMALLILLFFSAVISGSEVAFFSLSHTQREEMKESKSQTDKLILKLLAKPQKLLATILISNNFVNIAIVILAEYLIRQTFDFGDSKLLQLLVSVVAITFLLLMCGEVIPKVYANTNPMGFARRFASTFEFLNKLLTMFSAPLMLISKGVDLFSSKKNRNDVLSVENISQAFEVTAAGEEHQDDKHILEGVISFGKTEAKQVMTPRIDIFALPETATFPQVRKEILKNGFSRIPVYGENLDDIKGVLYIKDLLPYLQEKEFDWSSLLRETIYVPGNRKIDDILVDFQESKVHMAIVVDEYGGTLGVISMEDIIEEIVGNIADEFDDDDVVYSKIDDNMYLFEGKTSLKDFYKILDIEEKEELFEEQKGESDSLAGFLLELCGAFPKKGDEYHFDRYTFTVEALDKKRIKQVKVTIHDHIEEQ